MPCARLGGTFDLGKVRTPEGTSIGGGSCSHRAGHRVRYDFSSSFRIFIATGEFRRNKIRPSASFADVSAGRMAPDRIDHPRHDERDPEDDLNEDASADSRLRFAQMATRSAEQGWGITRASH